MASARGRDAVRKLGWKQRCVTRGMSGSCAGQKRSASASEPMPAKRSAVGPSVTSLQTALQYEADRRGRVEQSVEQLRLELQMMGRLLATAREQLVACGAANIAQSGICVRTPPPPMPQGQRGAGRSKSDAKLVQRLQSELAESRAQCSRLETQVETQRQKMALASTAKRELLGVVAEMGEFLASQA